MRHNFSITLLCLLQFYLNFFYFFYKIACFSVCKKNFSRKIFCFARHSGPLSLFYRAAEDFFPRRMLIEQEKYFSLRKNRTITLKKFF